MNNQFARDIDAGLSAEPKSLPSKYFYDEQGDKLFQQIMGLREYYLTDAEYEILYRYKENLHKTFLTDQYPLNLIELGAGDGLKTKVLLRYFLEEQADFSYIPVDISQNVLQLLEQDLKETFPGLRFGGLQGDYFEVLKIIKHDFKGRNLILLLGANIGNFSFTEAKSFLRSLAAHMNQHDMLLIGFDLQKDPLTILNAYNDKSGITRAFNLNLLHRINKELGGDFNALHYYHYPVYDPTCGEARSYIVSKIAQSVYIGALNKSFEFGYGEPILTEISKKYNDRQINQLAEFAGFKILNHFTDSRHFFIDSLWQREW